MTKRLVRKIAPKFWLLWLIWGGLFAVVEGVALWRRNPEEMQHQGFYSSDTLSGHVWWLNDRLWGLNLFGALWGWLTVHFFLGDPLKFRSTRRS